MISFRFRLTHIRLVSLLVTLSPFLPALLAPPALLYLLATPYPVYRLPVKIDVHLTEDHLIRNVLHKIDMPSVQLETNSSWETLSLEEEKARRKLEPYIRPQLERIKKSSTKQQKEMYRRYLKELDIMALRIPKFSSNYKNPCWREKNYKPTTCPFLEKVNRNHSESDTFYTLRCLPYFAIIGQPKCGTTDIYNKLSKHPDVTLPTKKEPYWLNRRRFSRQCSSLSTYFDYFHKNAKQIEASFLKHQDSQNVYHQMITGEGSVDIMWDNHLWKELPRNRKCKEPCFTNADYLHHLNPATKLIVALRNPIERVYSDYMFEHIYLKYHPDKVDFHQRIVEAIYQFNSCLKTNSLRYCVYNPHLESTLSKVRPLVGLYYVHIEDWLRVFPRDQIHIIKFEDYTNNTLTEMKKLFKFLSLSELPEAETAVVMETGNRNQRPASSAGEGDMEEETRGILREFYKPYNIRLAKLLNDPRFLWET